MASTSGTSRRNDASPPLHAFAAKASGVFLRAQPLPSSTTPAPHPPLTPNPLPASGGRENTAPNFQYARICLPDRRPDAPWKTRGPFAAVSRTGGLDLHLVLDLPAHRDDGALDLHERSVRSPPFRWAR